MSSALADFGYSSAPARPTSRPTPFKKPMRPQATDLVHKRTTSLRLTKSQLKGLQVIGQVDDKFILCLVSVRPCPVRELMVFDQHAVHERVRLEWLQRQLSSAKELSASILPPLVFSIPSSLYRQEDLVSLAGLRQYGFEVQTSVGGGKVEVRVAAVPGALLSKLVSPRNSFSTLPSYNLQHILRKCLVDSITASPADGTPSIRPRAIDDLLATVACRGNKGKLANSVSLGALKFNTHLTTEQCRSLMEDLSLCDFPFQCAHGR